MILIRCTVSFFKPAIATRGRTVRLRMQADAIEDMERPNNMSRPSKPSKPALETERESKSDLASIVKAAVQKQIAALRTELIGRPPARNVSSPPPVHTQVPREEVEEIEEKPARTSPAAGKPLDMACRVEGCPNRSGGPRNGYLCPFHRRTLSAEEQQAARARYKLAHRGGSPVVPHVPASAIPTPLATPRVAAAPIIRRPSANVSQALSPSEKAARDEEIARAWSSGARKDTPLRISPVAPAAPAVDDSIGNRASPRNDEGAAPQVQFHARVEQPRHEQPVRREYVPGARTERNLSAYSEDEAAAAPQAPAPAPAAPPQPPRVEEPRLGNTPAGSDYALVIERTRLIESKKLGPTLEVRFLVAEGPHQGTVARGQFPLSGKGMPVLVQAALGQEFDAQNLAMVMQLEGKRILADVVSTGTDPGALSLVRNLRAPA